MRPALTATLFLLAISLPAHAGWSVSQGSAMIETDGSSALSLTCNNNGNTGYEPKWTVRVDALDTRSMGPNTRMVFRFPGRAPITLMGENRLGFVSFDGINQPSQSDLRTVVNRLKAAARVTITLIDDSTGLAMEPLAFNLRGSSRAIGEIQKNCL